MAFSFVAMLNGSRFVLLELLLVAFVITASFWAGASGGLAVGLAGAAGHVALGSIGGDWGRHNQAFSVVAVCAFLAYGWIFGLTAAHLRRRHAADAKPPAAAGAGGSQGLLTAEEGQALLRVESEDAYRSGNELAIINVQAVVREGTRPAQARHAFRAVARTFEAFASGRMHPVLVAKNQLAMVIPACQPDEVSIFERAVVAALGEATYADRRAGNRAKASLALRLDSNFVLLAPSTIGVEEVFKAPEQRLDEAVQTSTLRDKVAA
ncbi:MAG: hypothetical protein ACLGH7_04130 [Actinomycetes bacterium]